MTKYMALVALICCGQALADLSSNFVQDFKIKVHIVRSSVYSILSKEYKGADSREIMTLLDDLQKVNRNNYEVHKIIDDIVSFNAVIDNARMPDFCAALSEYENYTSLLATFIANLGIPADLKTITTNIAAEAKMDASILVRRFNLQWIHPADKQITIGNKKFMLPQKTYSPPAKKGMFEGLKSKFNR